jgi:hypothetical protein
LLVIFSHKFVKFFLNYTASLKGWEPTDLTPENPEINPEKVRVSVFESLWVTFHCYIIWLRAHSQLVKNCFTLSAHAMFSAADATAKSGATGANDTPDPPGMRCSTVHSRPLSRWLVGPIAVGPTRQWLSGRETKVRERVPPPPSSVDRNVLELSAVLCCCLLEQQSYSVYWKPSYFLLYFWIFPSFYDTLSIPNYVIFYF